jgi:hypothetical protein
MLLKTDYQDDILDLTQNANRKFNEVTNQDGSKSFEDVTEYEQEGTPFGAQDVNAITKALTDEAHGVSFQFGIDGNGDYGYIKDGEETVTPFRNRHTETITPNSRATVDMGLYHKKRYVDLSAVPNVNTETYVAGNSNQTVDMGATNNYRYVNLYHAWEQGVWDADNRADPNTINYQTGYNNGRASINLGVVKVFQQGSRGSFNCAVGDILVMHNVDDSYFAVYSGANLVVNNPIGNAHLRIYQATATTVDLTNGGNSTLHVWRVYRG